MPDPKETPEVTPEVKVEAPPEAAAKVTKEATDKLGEATDPTAAGLTVDPDKAPEAATPATEEGATEAKEAEKEAESEDPATAAGNLLLETAKETTGQVAVFFKALGELLKKYGSAFYSFSPGGYASSLTNEQFTEEQLAAMTKKASETVNNDLEADMKLDPTLADSLKAAKTAEEKSTMYVCSMLGLESMSKTQSLSSRLKNAKNEEDKLYKTYSEEEVYGALKADSFPRGSVIIFADNLAKMWEGATMCAYATGEGTEFVYYNPKTDKTESFNVGKSGSQVNHFNIRAVFTPTVPVAATAEEPVAATAETPVEPQFSEAPTATDEILDDIINGPQSDPSKDPKAPSVEPK